ncbi:MAG: hypothetical protein U0T79_09355 [Ferruginibacter sp.]
MDNINKVSLTQKVIACILTAIVFAYPLGRLNPTFRPAFISTPFLVLLGWTIFIAFVAFIFIWQRLEQKNKVNSYSILGLIQSVLVYALAFNFTKWGLLKILRLHMTTSLGFMEMPMTMLSGEKQLSHFFGQSYPMVCVLGLLEISGAIFILFRNTRLLGATILFVMTANIVIIDTLYYVYSPLPEAITLLVGVIYIAYQDKEKIKTFFFNATKDLPKYNFENQFLKNSLRLSAIIIPVIFLTPLYKTQIRQGITGKYNILKMAVNGVDKAIDKCSDTTFSKVYFDFGDNLIFTNTNFSKRQIGHFTFNNTARTFEVIWQYPTVVKDIFKGSISNLDNDNRMELNGIMGKDTLRIELEKMQVKNFNETY